MQHTKARLIPWLQVTLAVSTALPAALPALDAAPLPVHSAKATRPLLSPKPPFTRPEMMSHEPVVTGVTKHGTSPPEPFRALITSEG